MAERLIGTVDHYFKDIGVAGVALSGYLKVGDRIHVQGHTTDFEQTVDSIEVEHQGLAEVASGQSIGIKVPERCRAGDHVFKLD